jgi:hypothetical protein
MRSERLWIAAVISALATFAHAQGNSPQGYPPTLLNPQGCGLIYTYNATNNWAWITIYDPGEHNHMDWGWVGPHMDRSWTGGGMAWWKSPGWAATKNRYACGLGFVVRAEVKKGPPANTPNIADLTTTLTLNGSNSSRVCLQTSNGTVFTWSSQFGCLEADPTWQGNRPR